MSNSVFDQMMGYAEEEKFSLWHRDTFEYVNRKEDVGDLSQEAITLPMKVVLEKLDRIPKWEGTLKEFMDLGFSKEEVAASIQGAFDLGLLSQITTTKNF